MIFISNIKKLLSIIISKINFIISIKYICRFELIMYSTLIIFYSCTQYGSHTSNIPKRALIKSDSLNLDSSNIKSEDFNSFFLLFSEDTEFQLERVVFPFKAYSLDSTETIICNVPLQKRQWMHINLLFENGCVSCIYDNFKHELRNTDERVFAIEEMEHEGATNYYFKRIKGNWYLIKQEAFAY